MISDCQGLLIGAEWNCKFCALMAFSTVVAYLASLGMLRWQEPSWKRRLCLVLPVTTDLAMAGSLWRAMFSWQPGSEIIGGDLLVRMIGLAASFAHLGPNTFELR